MFICLWQVTFLSEGWFNNRFLKEYFQIFSKTLILTSSEDINALFCCTNLIFVSFYLNKNELQLMQLQLLYWMQYFSIQMARREFEGLGNRGAKFPHFHQKKYKLMAIDESFFDPVWIVPEFHIWKKVAVCCNDSRGLKEVKITTIFHELAIMRRRDRWVCQYFHSIINSFMTTWLEL